MATIKQREAKAPGETVVRFSANQRLQHVVVMVAFIALVVTGLPQRFPDHAWSVWFLQNAGGIYTVRFIHRSFGIVFAIASVYHIGTLLHHVLWKRRPLSMLLTIKDFRDAVAAFRYDLGLTDVHPRFGRYDFRQKFEYWGMIFGGAVMVFSGLMLMYPVWVTRLLPGELIPVAKTAHSYEGLLAVLIIIVWHLYGAHIGPDKFPFDPTIFTGRVTRDRMRQEHPLEYEELLEREAPSAGGSHEDG